MLPILSLLVAVSLHFATTPATQSPETIRQFLLERDLSAEHSYAIAPAALEAIQGSGRGFPLAQLFTVQGVLIFEEDGYTLGMSKRLRRALVERQPVPGGISLADQLRDLRTFEGRTVEPEALPSSTFVLLDHWAVWCAACKPQMKLLERIASDPATPGILLLKVNWDRLEPPDLREPDHDRRQRLRGPG